MEKEKQIEDKDLATLNAYRNKYYADGNSTENGLVANSINNILPILVDIKNKGYRKQSEGEWIGKGMAHCSECGNVVNFRNASRWLYNFCPNCGAKMKGGE